MVINKLACSLVGKNQKINIIPGSHAHEAYGQHEVMEQFSCSYGLNRVFYDELNKGKMSITGIDPDGEARIVELVDHRFYIATLFLPQISSRPASPHPLIVAYLRNALDFQASR